MRLFLGTLVVATVCSIAVPRMPTTAGTMVPRPAPVVTSITSTAHGITPTAALIIGHTVPRTMLVATVTAVLLARRVIPIAVPTVARLATRTEDLIVVHLVLIVDQAAALARNAMPIVGRIADQTVDRPRGLIVDQAVVLARSVMPIVVLVVVPPDHHVTRIVDLHRVLIGDLIVGHLDRRPAAVANVLPIVAEIAAVARTEPGHSSTSSKRLDEWIRCAA